MSFPCFSWKNRENWHATFDCTTITTYVFGTSGSVDARSGNRQRISRYGTSTWDEGWTRKLSCVSLHPSSFILPKRLRNRGKERGV